MSTVVIKCGCVCRVALVTTNMSRGTRSKNLTPIAPAKSSTNLDDLSEESRSIVMLFRNDISELKTHFESLLKRKDAEISELKESVSHLKEELSKAKLLIDDADAYERKDTVILSGEHIPLAETGENCIEIVKNIVKDHFKINLSTETISTAHRLGRKPPNQTPDRRNIVVKLVRRDLKQDLIHASRKQMRPAKLFVFESLTPSRNTLLYALRQMKKSKLIKGCTSYDGRIYAYTAAPNLDKDIRHHISSYDSLKSFCVKFVKQPLEVFLESWNH